MWPKSPNPSEDRCCARARYHPQVIEPTDEHRAHVQRIIHEHPFTADDLDWDELARLVHSAHERRRHHAMNLRYMSVPATDGWVYRVQSHRHVRALLTLEPDALDERAGLDMQLGLGVRREGLDRTKLGVPHALIDVSDWRGMDREQTRDAVQALADDASALSHS